MRKLRFITVAILTGIVLLFVARLKRADEPRMNMLSSQVTINDPPSMQMYFFIEKYADEYGIPKKFAYGIAYAETRYEGPFDWNYKQDHSSPVGALGPMQVMPATARLIWPNMTITNKMLSGDIEFNVKTSMKLLNRLYMKYKDWKLVFGAYNTGTPCVNGYAINVYNYEPKWKYSETSDF